MQTRRQFIKTAAVGMAALTIPSMVMGDAARLKMLAKTGFVEGEYFDLRNTNPIRFENNISFVNCRFELGEGQMFISCDPRHNPAILHDENSPYLSIIDSHIDFTE